MIDSLKNHVKFVSGDKVAFVSAIFAGLLAHFYIYTNMFLGHDASYLHSYMPTYDLLTGRFVGPLVKAIHGSMQAPWLIGMICLVLLGLSSVLVCRMLHIKSKVHLVLISACIATWPTVVSINGFMFLAVQHIFAFFAACLAAYIADRYKWGFVAAIALVVISMGNYQAYWGTTASLLILCIIRYILSPESTTKTLLIKCARALLTLALGLLFYYQLWVFLVDLLGLQKPAFLGMDDIGFASVNEFLRVLYSTYRTVFRFFLYPNEFSYYPVWLMVAVCISVLLALFLICRIVVMAKIYKNPIKVTTLVLAFLLYPIAMNSTEVFSAGQSVRLLAFYAFVTPLFLLPMVLEKLNGPLAEFNLKRHAKKLLYASIIAITLSSLNGIYGANISYLRLEANYHIALSQATTKLTMITSQEGYRRDTPVAIIGNTHWWALPEFSRRGFDWMRDVPGVHDIALTYFLPIHAFLQMLSPHINLVSNTSVYASLPEVQALEVFPAHNSIIWVGDTLVLRLG